MNKISLKDIVRQGEGSVASEMDGEKVLLSIEKSKYYNLGEIGGKIWDLMEKSIAVQEMVSTLTMTFDVLPSECEEHVISFLEHLLKEGLIRTGE